MTNKQKQVLEDIESSLYDAGISAETLKDRKIAIARVLAQANKALEVATAAEQTTIAEQLQQRIERLQELLDRADEIMPEASSDDGAGGKDGDTDVDAHSGGAGEDSDKNDSEAPGDSKADGNNTSKSDMKDSDDEEASKSSGKDTPNSDSDELGTSGGSGTSEDKVDGDTGDDVRSSGSSSSGGGGANGGGGGGSGADGGGDGGSGAGTGSGGDDGDAGAASSSSASSGEDEDARDSATKPKVKDNKVQLDPFANGKGSKLPKDLKDKLDRGELKVESTFEAAKRILSELGGEARRGAAQGLKDLLAKRGITVEESFKRPLQEAIKKTLAQMSEDEFNAELDTTMALVDKVIKVDYSDDLPARVAEIKRDAMSSTARMELEKEDAEHTKSARATAKKAYEKENDKYKKIKPLDGLETFRANLFRTVKDQVAEAEDEVDSWAALDRRHEDDPSIIKKGHILDDGEEDIPSINVYFDQSGSWSSRDVEVGKRAISVINDFHENGEIKLNIYYISAAGVCRNAAEARAKGGAEGWAAALQHIRDSKVKNVIVLSDSDLDYFAWSNRPTGDNGRTIVDGCVWWLWKDNEVSEKAPKELIGRRGNFHYHFVVD